MIPCIDACNREHVSVTSIYTLTLTLMCSPFIVSTARQDTPLVSISRELPDALSLSHGGEDFSGSPSSQPKWHLPESVIQRQILLNKLGRSSAGGQLDIESAEDLAVTSVASYRGGKQAHPPRSDTGSFSSDTGEEAAGQKLRQLVSAQLDRISEEEDDTEDMMSLEERDDLIDDDEIGSSHHAWDDSVADEEEEDEEEEKEEVIKELAEGYKAAVGGSTKGTSSLTGSESDQATNNEPSLKPSEGLSVTTMDADASLRLLRSLVAGLPPPTDKENMQIGPGLGGQFAMKGGLAKLDRETSSHLEFTPQSLEPTSRSSDKAAPEVPGSSGRASLFGTESKRRWAAAATSANDSQRSDALEAALLSGAGTAVVKSSDDGFSAESQQCGPVAAAFSHRFPAYGVGLIDRLMSLEDHGLFKWETAQGRQPNQQRSHRQGLASLDGTGSHLPAGERPPGPRGEEGPMGSNVGGLTQDTAQLVEAMAAALASSSSNAASPPGSQQASINNNDRPFSRAPLPTSYLQSHPRPLLAERRTGSASSASSGENADERQVALDQLRQEVFGSQHDGPLSAAESSSPQNASQRAVKESLSSGTWLSGGGDDITSQSSARLIGGAGSRSHSGVGPGPSDKLDGGANLLGALAMRSSTRWPRIYRPPRARGGHVILDLCVHDAESEAEARRQQGSNGPAGLSLGAEFGKLERHVSQSHPGDSMCTMYLHVTYPEESVRH